MREARSWDYGRIKLVCFSVEELDCVGRITKCKDVRRAGVECESRWGKRCAWEGDNVLQDANS